MIRLERERVGGNVRGKLQTVLESLSLIFLFVTYGKKEWGREGGEKNALEGSCAA